MAALKCAPFVITSWLLFYVMWRSDAQSATCTRINNCICRFPNGRILDLNPLDNKSKGIYRFQAPANDTYNYFYNPCSGFPCDTNSAASICQKDKLEKYIYDIGDENDVTFTTRNGKLAILYKAKASIPFQRQSYVSLHCDCSEEGRMTARGVAPESQIIYDMDLYTRHACDVECSSGGLSVGDSLLIIFFVSIIVYLIVGIVINAAVLKKEGKERIPNLTFWTAIPGLVLEGFRFSLNKIRGQKTNYQEIKS